jgi:hypothetical protein
MEIDPSVPRARASLTLVRVFVRQTRVFKGGRYAPSSIKMARLRCVCSTEFDVALSRWKNCDVDKCIGCARHKAKTRGLGVFGNGKRLRVK